MTKSLYEEALADAQQLRELAEETAKNKLIETVMPQIRDMVNRKIMGEQLEDDDLDALVDDAQPLEPIEVPEPEDKEGHSVGDQSGNVINIDAAGDVNIEIEGSDDDDDDGDDDDELVLDGPMAEALIRMLNSSDNDMSRTQLIKLENTFTKLKTIVENVDFTKLNSNQKRRINKSFVVCVREARKLQKQLILNEQATQGDLEHRLTTMIKEMKNMSKSNSRNIFDFLFEAEDVKEMDKMEADHKEEADKKDLEEAELSLEITDEEREEIAGAEDADAVEAALEDILGDLEVSMEPAGEEGGEGGEEAEEAEGDEPEAEGGDEIEVAEEGVVYEIDENMLRRELQRLTEEAADEADQFGGGEVPHGDVFVDVDEDDLINALADELGDVAPAAAAPAVAESRLNRSASRKLREARRIMAKQDSTIEALKAQLVEMNLFNAKLLYANKLMQNRNLSLKNQKTIVEALDSASTIREAKLLYKSLSSSLERKVSSRGGLNEGSLRKLGSASRSTRSAQPKTEANREADRWAVLAGI